MDIYAVFGERFPRVQTERDFSFAAHTTIGCGGNAAFAVSPESAEETAEILSFLKAERIPYCFLGAGANVLPKDGYWEGVVIRFQRLCSLQAEDNLIYAGAGVSGGKLLRFATEQNLGGFEPLAGIPMTVGGGAAMNAGIRGTHFSDLVVSVRGVENGTMRTFTLKECGYSDKYSIFLQDIAITSVCLRGKKSNYVAQNIAYYLARRSALPKGRSMGCTFVNPEGMSAGEIIDRCGLKGLTVGKACVSDVHANFIINEGSSSRDVAELITVVKEEVKRQTGILLREEIRRIQ